MENTYNYFFSSVPQVLAGILGLFGVFIVFKISDVKNQIKEIKEEFINELASYEYNFSSRDVGNWQDIVWKAITRKDFIRVYFFIESLTQMAKEKDLKYLQEFLIDFKIRHSFLQEFKNGLIKKTISVSWLTVINIAYCLIMLIFGSWLGHCKAYSISAFIPAIGLSVFILYMLMVIIKYSFED